ncbi:MAG TPA: tetratricopeptide repeat protein [Kofleriaceae bacterium]|nr:tetratricopeptide repeat protein [Kofleriaceae bacterium]
MGGLDPDQPTEEPTGVTRREGPGSGPRRAAERLERGTLVGRYVVIALVGEGGMGVVYSAFDPELDRKVAIKLLQARPAAGSSGGEQAWLLREAQAMARLSHPNVLAVHDVGTLPGDRVFVAMELVEGETLRQWLRGPRRPWRDVLGVMRAAGAGLAAAHASGLVHRDFKPENVLVGRDGRVRVMDFGLARLADAEDLPPPDQAVDVHSPLSATLTAAGALVGTPAYIAPELRGGAAADARSDQFSFGVALYEALFRARPYSKEAPASAGPPRPPADSRVPARLQRAVLRAIAPEPAARFPSMDALLAELAIDLARPRRRALGVAAAVLSLGGAVAAGFALSSRGASTEPCTGIEHRLAGRWDDAVRSATRTAYLATKLPFAADAYAGVARALDAYSKDWTDAAVDACRATRVRREQGEDALALRQGCLERRLDELGALTRLLAGADADLVQKADQVVAGLEPVRACSNVAALRAAEQPPTEPKAKLVELGARLAEAKAELLVGHYLASVIAGKKAERLADELHYPPYKAEALVVEGASLMSANNLEDATAACQEAVWQAVQGRRDDVAAGASLCAAATAAQHDVGAARVWLGLARAMNARGGLDPSLELREVEVEGVVAALAGDLAGAIAAQQQALARAAKALGPDNPLLWTDEEVIGATYARSGAFDKATPHLERALALHQRSVGPDHPDLATILTTLGTCYERAGDAAKSRAAYERALAIREKSDGANSPTLVLTLNNMADGMIKAGDPAGALTFLDRASAISERTAGPDNPLGQVVSTTRAEALAAQGKLADARAQYDAVIASESKTRSPFLGQTLGSRATMELAAKQWAEAAALEQRAIVAFEAAGGKDSPDLWQPLTGLARADVELGHPADARPLLERAIAIGERAQIAASDLAPTRDLYAKLTAR